MFKKKILVSTAIVTVAAFGMLTPNLASAQVLSETINSKTGEVISKSIVNATIISRTIDSATGDVISETIIAHGFATTRSKGTAGSIIVRKIDASSGKVISETVETRGVISTSVDSKTGVVVGHSVKGTPVIIRTVDSATGEVLSETVMNGGVTTTRAPSQAGNGVLIRKVNSQTGTVISETVENSPVIGQSVTLPSGKIIAETVTPDEVVSTGTRLQVDPAQVAAQTFKISFDDLVATGQPTLERAIRQLPQNSLGSSEVGGALSQTTGSGFNLSGMSTINLRGLGNDSTLILVNGKRIGRQGALGIGSDISMIPMEAIERIEVVMDGASSIYGSDAVGGVVNIILKKDRKDLVASFSVGLPEGGGFTEYQADIGGGYSWETGGASVALSHYHTGSLEVGDRGFAIDDGVFSGGLTNITFPFGGTNYLVPENFSGNPADLVLGEAPTGNRKLTLIPETDRYSGRIDINQNLSETVEATLGYSFSKSDSLTPVNLDGVTFSGGGFGAFFDHRTNPFNTFGGFVGVRGFQLTDKPTFVETENEVHNISLGLTGDLGVSDWNWELSAGYNQSKLHSTRVNAINSSAVFSLLRAGLDHDDNPATPVIFYDPLTGSTPEVHDSMVFDANVDTESKSKFAEAIVRGSLFEMPAGSVKAVAGVSYIKDELTTVSDSFLGATSTTGTQPVDSSGEQSSKSIFGEILVPLIGSANEMPLFKQLDVTGAVRYDDYNTSAGESTTGSIGVVWSPASILKFRANFASSFVAPTISQAFIPTNHFLFPGRAFIYDGATPPTFLRREDVYYITGGNSELSPETADSVSLGLDFNPIDNLSISITHHETDYTNRIVRHNIGEWTNFIDHPSFAALGRSNIPTFVGAPDPSTTNLFTGAPVTNVDGYIWDQRWKNVAQVELKGIDFYARYTHETDIGTFDVSFNDSYTYRYDVTGETGAITSQVDEGALGIEILPENSYSANLGWEDKGLNINVNVNSRSSTKFNGANFNRVVNPPTNVNLSIGYDIGNGELFDASGILDGTRLNLSISNLTNKDVVVSQTDNTTGVTTIAPRLFPSLTEARGRMYTLKVTKTF